MKADIGIHFIIAIFILFESWTAAIDIPYEDLNNPYKFCPPRSSCVGVDQKTAASEAIDNYDGVGGLRRNCLCDDRCSEYGDCCTDSTHFDPVEQQNAAERHGCVYITDESGGTYVVNRCPAKWTNTRVRDACHAAAIDRYSMIGNPVTSRTTGHAYQNRFCAMCNRDVADPILWGTRIVCNGLLGVAAGEKQAVLDTLRYDAAAGRWEVKYFGDTYDCEQILVPPATTRIRRCLPNAVITCHPQWPNDEIRSNCEAYTTVMYYDSLPYKNIHCAICNHVLVQNVTCLTSSITLRFPSQFSERSFNALFIAQPGHRECRDPDTFYDPRNKTCQSLRTLVSDDEVPLNCSRVAMYSTPAEGWRPPNANANYVTLQNGSIVVCVDANQTATAEPARYVALTYVGLGVSAVLLIVHLAVFAVLPEMKNLSGKNLASFCVSLLCSYSSFVAGNWLTGPACYAGAVFTYYAFITSFAWMLVMSFDCWRSLRLATYELRVTSGRQTKKFLVYSAVCWLVPAMMTFVAVAVDTVLAVPNDPNDPYDVRPRFGEDQCWFGNNTALLLFFAGPLTIIMAVNIVLFGWTACMIHSSRATVRHINTRHLRRDFRMYCRLGVLMGLTWSTGVVARYTDSEYTWMMFVFLNTFQGLFIFIAFTCRRRILDSLVRSVGGGNLGLGHLSHEKSNDGDKHSRSPPPSSFTWSSSDNSAPISSEKTTDTLY